MSVTTRIGVQGMTCSHCERAVTSELTALPGVNSVDIVLVKGGSSTVTVTSAEALDQDDVRAAIAEEGYEVTSMELVDTQEAQPVVPDGLAPAPSGSMLVDGASQAGCGCGCKGAGRGGQGVGLPIVAAG